MATADSNPDYRLKSPRIRIAPSLLAADFGELKEQIKMIESAGADLLHLDVMDGHFVPNISFGVPVIEKIRGVTDLYFDTHVMISNPLKYAEPFIKAGSDNYTFHIEATETPEAVIEVVRKLGADVGISLNPTTPAETLTDVLEDIDLVLIMSVWPGFGGQKFIPEVLPKTAELSSKIRPNQRLEIDGGIAPGTISQAAEAGADTFVAGSAIFNASDPPTALRDLRRQAEKISGSRPSD